MRGVTRNLLQSNILRRLRTSHGLTQDQFASAAGVSSRAVYNAECGLYEDVPETIAITLHKMTSFSMEQITEQYKEFRSLVRKSTKDRILEEYFVLFGDAAPIVRLQLGLVMTESDFLNSFLINPGTFFKLKTGKLRHLPDEVVIALEESGCPTTVVGWIAERTKTYVPDRVYPTRVK